MVSVIGDGEARGIETTWEAALLLNCGRAAFVFPAKAGIQNACTEANPLRAAEPAHPAPIHIQFLGDSKVTWSDVPGIQPSPD